MANEIKYTFIGDATQLTQTMAGVGSASEDMANRVGDASDSFISDQDRAKFAAQQRSKEIRDALNDEMRDGWDKATEAGDRWESRAMGFRDTITGLGDSFKGASSIIKGDFSADALLAAGAGIGDLASGFANFLLPTLKKAVTWLGTTKVGMLAQAAATQVVTAAQWLWNAAMSANPIALVVIAIVALIAIFVVLWNKCDWFRNLWVGLWKGIKSTASNVWEWLKGLPESLKTAFTTLGDIIFGPFKWAFNKVADAWNATVGKLSWTVPSWVPFIGGNTISAPKLPHFHTGTSRVPGPPGQDVIAVVQAGERVFTSAQADAMDRGAVTGDTFIFHLEVDPTKFKTIEDFMAWVDNLRNSQRRGLAVA